MIHSFALKERSFGFTVVTEKNESDQRFLIQNRSYIRSMISSRCALHLRPLSCVFLFLSSSNIMREENKRKMLRAG